MSSADARVCCAFRSCRGTGSRTGRIPCVRPTRGRAPLSHLSALHGALWCVLHCRSDPQPGDRVRGRVGGACRYSPRQAPVPNSGALAREQVLVRGLRENLGDKRDGFYGHDRSCSCSSWGASRAFSRWPPDRPRWLLDPVVRPVALVAAATPPNLSGFRHGGDSPQDKEPVHFSTWSTRPTPSERTPELAGPRW